MNLNALTPKSVLYFLCSFLTICSCSKDTDLLADYTSVDKELLIGTFVRNDKYQISINNNEEEEVIEVIVNEESENTPSIEPDENNGTTVNDSYELTSDVSIVLDVLANDTFNNMDRVTIIETTQPDNGEVVINEDNTLSFRPSTIEANENDFSYTAEYTNENGIVSQEVGFVSVSVKENPNKIITDMGELKAFPGAEGFGKNATGGRGGTVVEVTNLNDSGSGSLRAALLMTVPRTIVFKVGGTIKCNDYLKIPRSSGNVTIAGQTAPGDGIAIEGAELRIEASNVIVRHIRIRPGPNTSGTNEDGLRILGFGGNRTENVIIDHVSITWGKDEIVEIGGIGSGSNVRNVTIQNSIIGENISAQHKFGLLLWNNANNISVYQNLFVNNVERNLRSSTCTSSFEMINNVVYGYRAATVPTYENAFDIIGNVYKTNPNLSAESYTIKLSASQNNCPDGKISLTKAYIHNNTLNGSFATVSSELNPFLRSSRNFNSGIIPLGANKVEDNVLNNVGANLQKIDAVDSRLIDWAENRTGRLINSISEFGGYPNLSGGEAYEDNDRDGIDDRWEEANGLNPSSRSDGNQDPNGDGYTNLDEFLHYLTLQ